MEVPAREIHPIVHCVVNNKNFVDYNDINEVCPYRERDDDITPQIAAVNHKEGICIFLRKEGADPRNVSQNDLTPLQYVPLSKAPLAFVAKLLKAKANPDGWDLVELQQFTPLQTAVINDRDDVVKEFISAGALVTLLPVTDPEHFIHNKKLSQMIRNLASKGDELCSKIGCFLDMEIAVQEKTPEKVFKTFDSHMLWEHPQTHLTMIETLFNVTGPDAEKYRQRSIKWLKDTGNLNSYIAGAVSRFPNIPEKHVHWATVSLSVISCTMEAIPNEQALAIIPQLLEQLSSKERPDIWEAVLQTLYVITQKTKGTNGWDHNFIEKLCKTVAPFVEDQHSSDIRVFTYGVFGNLLSVEHAANIFTSVGITSVPEDILTSADMTMLKDLKEELRRLKNHFSKPKSECEDGKALTRSENRTDEQESPHGPAAATIKKTQKWFPVSEKWREELTELVSTDESEITRVTSLRYLNKEKFCIAQGSGVTEVFLGLRDDGTEVAIKRMSKCNYKVMKNEEEITRLHGLNHPSIVQYVDFTEDDNFGYLCLQLCESNVEEYIKKKVDYPVREKLVKQVLKGLKVLHCHKPPILHRDLKPQNVLIDVNERARLADFGISRRLPKDQTTHHTASAGTIGWKAKETLAEEADSSAKIPYKRSTDIQVAGMLIYYILSGGHHPFGKPYECEYNIHKGKYTLDHVPDVVAKDLIEWMIDEEPKNRPEVEECLSHPFFWTAERRVEYLRRIGNRVEVKNWGKTDQELISGSFKQWKKEFPEELVQKMESKNKAYPENTLGLLRFIRNAHEHRAEDVAKLDLMSMFPDLFGCVYIFANSQGWNSETPLKEMFGTLFSRGEKHLNAPVQESQPISAQSTVNDTTLNTAV